MECRGGAATSFRSWWWRRQYKDCVAARQRWAWATLLQQGKCAATAVDMRNGEQGGSSTSHFPPFRSRSRVSAQGVVISTSVVADMEICAMVESDMSGALPAGVTNDLRRPARQ